jgi:hypothetical protein
MPGTIQNEPIDVLKAERIESEFILAEALQQEAAHCAQIVSDRDGVESALGAEKSGKVLLDATYRSGVDGLRGCRDATQTAQKSEQLPAGGCVAAPGAISACPIPQK